MHQSVLDAFIRFSTPLEGETHNPYLDVKGLCTVGIGCLINTASLWGPLPWVMPDGSPAPATEVTRQLTGLIARQDLSRLAYNQPAVLGATTIRLTDAGILQLCDQRLKQDEAYFVKAFPAFAAWPADAQLFACSIGWAEGPAWDKENPNLARVLRLSPPDFLSAIVHAPDTAHPGQYLAAAADISTKDNAGIVPRNAQNELALSSAEIVWRKGLDRSVLHWPLSPITDGTITAEEACT